MRKFSIVLKTCSTMNIQDLVTVFVAGVNIHCRSLLNRMLYLILEASCLEISCTSALKAYLLTVSHTVKPSNAQRPEPQPSGLKAARDLRNEAMIAYAIFMPFICISLCLFSGVMLLIQETETLNNGRKKASLPVTPVGLFFFVFS